MLARSHRLPALVPLLLAALAPATQAGVEEASYALSADFHASDGITRRLEGCMSFHNGGVFVSVSNASTSVDIQCDAYTDVDLLLFGFWSASVGGVRRGSGLHFFFGSFVLGSFEVGDGLDVRGPEDPFACAVCPPLSGTAPPSSPLAGTPAAPAWASAWALAWADLSPASAGAAGPWRGSRARSAAPRSTPWRRSDEDRRGAARPRSRRGSASRPTPRRGTRRRG